MANKDEKICIIGAGVSGLSAAFYLDRKGYKNITVLEKQSRVGGKCCTINYRGNTYEMGAMMIVHHNPHILEFMEIFDETQIGPVLYRAFFDERGNPVSQVAEEEAKEFQKQFFKLSNIVKQYEYIHKPGFQNVPKELCKPFTQWCKENRVPLVEKAYAPPFNGFGYGYLDEIAAIYVLKYLDFKILNYFIEIDHIITLVNGLQTIWEKVASYLEDVRLSREILSIKRDGKILVTTNLGVEEFDKLIITCPLEETLKFMDYTYMERELFSKIKYNDFYVFAYKLGNIPKVCGYMPNHFTKENIGHLLVWYYRWSNMDKNDIVTAYALGDDSMSVKDVRDTVECDFRRMGVNVKGLYDYRKWSHFPHVDCEILKQGFYRELEGMQSKNNTYYAGEIMAFALLDHCAQYSKYLVDKYF